MTPVIPDTELGISRGALLDGLANSPTDSQALANTELLCSFQVAVTSIVSDALGQANNASYLDALMMQDEQMILECSDHAQSVAKAKLMLGSPWRLTTEETMTHLRALGTNILQRYPDQALPPNFAWPHQQTFDFAQQCVGFLSDDPEVSQSA